MIPRVSYFQSHRRNLNGFLALPPLIQLSDWLSMSHMAEGAVGALRHAEIARYNCGDPTADIDVGELDRFTP